MTEPLGELDTDLFLKQYWQKEPCLIRQAFAKFTPALDENDVAGLACDELVESRLITGTYSSQNWQLTHGPFTEEELKQLPKENWTLLVQDVEKHYPPLSSLLSHFDFLPSWRHDDLMISVAAAGGSVGPHYDQYDVFLLQTSGSRRWQISTKFAPELLPDCDLNVLSGFNPETEWVLEAGDMLYLPPNIAHHGVALDTGMTWSIGFRAPSQADLLLAMGEWLASEQDEGQRYQDHDLSLPIRPGEVEATAIQQTLNLMRQCLDQSDKTIGFLGRFLSEYRQAHRPAACANKVTRKELVKAQDQSMVVKRNPWTKILWIEHKGKAQLFASGDVYSCSIDTAILLCGPPGGFALTSRLDNNQLELIKQLIQDGHVYLETNEPPSIQGLP